MRFHNSIVSALTIASLTLVVGCPAREVSKVDPKQSKEQENLVPVQLNRDVDILFVIDNSGSMAEEQASLAQNFNRFINVLENIEGGLPNVHIGVISTDVGAGPFGIQGCTGNGDNGSLQSAPQVGGCSPPSGAYIQDIDDGIKAAGFFRVAVRVVHLRFETGARPSGFLELGVEVNAGVASWRGHDINPEFEVFKRGLVAHIVKMAAFPVTSQLVFVDLPAVLVFFLEFPGGLPMEMPEILREPGAV